MSTHIIILIETNHIIHKSDLKMKRVLAIIYKTGGMNYKEKQETLCIARAIAYHSNRLSIAFAILKNNF